MRTSFPLATALLLLTATSALATPAWVSDQNLVPMRSGAGTEYRIIQNAVKSGTAVNVLGSDGSGWSKVEINGVEGYMPSQYLLDSPTAALQLATLQKKYANLEANFQQQKAQLDEVTRARNTLDGQVNALQKQLAASTGDLNRVKEVAADPLRVSESNRQLSEQMSLLQTELDQVKAKNALLTHDATYRGWLYGLGTVILGMIFGAWVKTRSQRARSSWG